MKIMEWQKSVQPTVVQFGAITATRMLEILIAVPRKREASSSPGAWAQITQNAVRLVLHAWARRRFPLCMRALYKRIVTGGRLKQAHHMLCRGSCICCMLILMQFM